MPERVTPTTVDEVAAVLRDPDAGVVCVRGGGTKRRWGAPPSACDVILETGRLDRVVDHAAGDMVVEVEAGVRLDRLAQVLAGAGQQLALDVPSYDDGTSLGAGTVGGALAVGLSGPRRWRNALLAKKLHPLDLDAPVVTAEDVGRRKRVAAPAGRTHLTLVVLGRRLDGEHGSKRRPSHEGDAEILSAED